MTLGDYLILWGLSTAVIFVIAGASSLATTWSADERRRYARVAFAAPLWPIGAVALVGYGMYRLWRAADLHLPKHAEWVKIPHVTEVDEPLDEAIRNYVPDDRHRAFREDR